jgi:hypothetical protein
MSEQSLQPAASAPKKAWYMRWWVWLIAAVLVVGGIGSLINPSSDADPSAAPQPQTESAEPTASEPRAALAPLDLERFLTDSGLAFDSATMSAGKA